MPSCDVTANLELLGKKAVQKEVGSALPLCTAYTLGGSSKRGKGQLSERGKGDANAASHAVVIHVGQVAYREESTSIRRGSMLYNDDVSWGLV
jgi:hypothetical protein